MNERKDDLIIGLLVIIIILQVYGLFFGEAPASPVQAVPTVRQSPGPPGGGSNPVPVSDS